MRCAAGCSCFPRSWRSDPPRRTSTSWCARPWGSLDGHFRAQVTPELGEVPPVSLDAEQVQKVIVNLLLNANDAVAEGGEIGVSTGLRTAGPRSP